MSTGAKIVLFILGLVVVAFVVAFVISSYLVSKLDGTGGVTTPHEEQTDMQQYASEDGYSFKYPDTYEISSRPSESGDGDALVLLPKGYVPPTGGEGPPTIAVQVFQNTHNLDIDTWLTTDSRANWHLSRPGGAEPIMVGGERGVSYGYSGLYETNAVLVGKNNRLYLFTVGWLNPDDPQVHDFDHLLETLEFN